MANKKKNAFDAPLKILKNLKGNGKKAKKNKKPKKPHPVLKKVMSVILVIVAIGIVCSTVAVTYVYKFGKDYVNSGKKIDLDLYKANQEQTSIIYGYDKNNELVELLRLHGAENRVWIYYNDIPQSMIDAFRCLEDKRFYDHKGVDWTSIINGVITTGFQRGSSTITQQLIKNLTGENGRTFSRKFYEILNALNLEKHYSKSTIMEAYLNTVYLGNGCYGIKTAAEKYFGKDVEDLNVAECAVIAAITQSPAEWDPLTEPKDNKARQEFCLKCMYEQGRLSKEEYDEAVAYELVFTNSENYKGSQIKNTDDTDEKDYTEDDVKYSNPESTDNSSYYVDYVIEKVISDLEKEYDLTYNEAWRKVFFGGLRIYTAVDSEIQSIAEKVYVNRETFPDEEDTEDNPAVQSAITIMDYSGRIVAMVGGAGEKTTFRGLNRASDSVRQPGSSIKPLSIYAPVIENNVATWSTMVQNYGIKLGSQRWPYNFGGLAGSPTNFVTVQYAVQDSLNTVPVQLARKIGLTKCFNFIVDDLHFTTLVTDEDDPNCDKNYSSICVGGMSQGVTTLEMTAAYAIFGNNGYYFEPFCYYKVTNNDGTEVLLETGDSTGEQVLSEASAGVMLQILKTVSSYGTGAGYGVKGFENFSKTGTTSDDKDRWYVGGTPYYVASVWYGYDTPKPIRNVYGNPAGKIYHAIMAEIHKNLDDKSFPTASGVVARKYCKISGDLATDTCKSTGTGYYKSTNLPAKCKGCAMIHAIGSEISDDMTKPQVSTTEVATTKQQPKTTKPATTAAPKTTEPATSEAAEPKPEPDNTEPAGD
ncbi:MAG: transglycosylase domain-containing protein [Oscillospiraceae bacterium]|nr:transglycosylase domain-containing protein [Oscillospiraceae bacterium]